MTHDMRLAVLRRDGRCVLSLTPGHQCRDQWGTPHSSTDVDRLTLEHVKDEPMMGKRAPSDMAHMVALCAAANIGVPSKNDRAFIRDYLRSVA